MTATSVRMTLGCEPIDPWISGRTRRSLGRPWPAALAESASVPLAQAVASLGPRRAPVLPTRRGAEGIALARGQLASRAGVHRSLRSPTPAARIRAQAQR
jgi:hypothetical protein